MSETDDAYATAAVAARTGLTEEQMCVVYLRVHYQMGVHAIAEALRMSPAAVERAEKEARERLQARRAGSLN